MLLLFRTVVAAPRVRVLLIWPLDYLFFPLADNGRVMEPFILLIIGYMSYLVAEIFHFSGIVAYVG